MPADFVAPTIDWWALTPQIILLSAALFILLGTSLARRHIPSAFSALVTIVAAIATFVVSLTLWVNVQAEGARTTLNGAFGIDSFSLFFTVLISLGVIATALIFQDYVERHSLAAPEFAALMLTSAAGAIVMASANDLIVLFLGLETFSIALYVIIALHVHRIDARESAIKYFVLGAVSSAFFLYGIALIYGATGTTNLTGIAEYLQSVGLANERLLLAGVALLVVGMAFKIAAVPFHMWAPDVYQGAPSPITGYLASIAKAAGFAALLRILFVAFSGETVNWTPLVSALSFATLTVGAVLAIRQDDVKRMLAYSSIAHAGFVLVGVQSANESGAAAALFYLFTYAFLALGSFAVLAFVSSKIDLPESLLANVPTGAPTGATAAPAAQAETEISRHSLSRYAGLAQRHPVLTLAFTFLLLAQAGVPLTSGFIGKFQVIASAVEADGYVIAIVAMLTAVISAFAYLRVVLAMYAPPSDHESSDHESTAHESTDPDTAASASPYLTPLPLTVQFALLGCVAITVLAGVVPQFLITFANDAVALLTFG